MSPILAQWIELPFRVDIFEFEISLHVKESEQQKAQLIALATTKISLREWLLTSIAARQSLGWETNDSKIEFVNEIKASNKLTINF